MEQKKKRKITVTIAGVTLTLITDESDSFVDAVVGHVHGQMRSILAGTVRTGSSTLDAALLCAIDAAGERMKAEKRIRNLEAQLSLYEVNVRRLNEELEALQKEKGVPSTKTASGKDSFARLSEALRAKGDGSTPEDKVKTLEKYLESKKNPLGGSDDGQEMTREEKIRYIESLLRE